MLIDPKDPYRQERNRINNAELGEINKLRKIFKDRPDLIGKVLDDNAKSFDLMRSEYRKRGLKV